MAEPIRVVPEDLHVSATAVGAHAEELQLRRTAATGRIEAAQAGVPAGAAAALSAAVAKWQVDTERHFICVVRPQQGTRPVRGRVQQDRARQRGERCFPWPPGVIGDNGGLR